MIINGKSIARDLKKTLKEEFKKRSKPTKLSVLVMDSNLATETFIALKKKFAEEIGVAVLEIKLSKKAKTETVIKKIEHVVQKSDGIIVQFPLAAHIDKKAVRDAVPISHDVDVISSAAMFAFEEHSSRVLPPVVGAIKEIARRNRLSFDEKNVVVIGEGALVGKPSALWARQEGAQVTLVNEETKNISEFTKEADIIILGAGVPGLLRPDMIQEGVAVFDAGTSEAKGKLSGDADPKCALKAFLFTPVPGGIGPITIAKIFENLLVLSS